MPPMKIDIDDLRVAPLQIQVDAAPGEFQLRDDRFTFEDRVRGELEFKMIGEDVEGRGELTATIACPCARCLVPVRAPCSVCVYEIWFRRVPGAAEPPPSDDEAVAGHYEGETLEPTELLREVLMAALPERLYCQPDCRGLCPSCGANLNHESCHCAGKVEEDADAPVPEWKRKLQAMRPASDSGE